MEIRKEDMPRIIQAVSGVSDPRRPKFNLRHKLSDILVMGLCSVMARGDGFGEMEDLGRGREEWFREFLELPNGIPDADTFRRVFERVCPSRLMECLQGWLAGEEGPGDREVNIDGKTLRGTAAEGQKAVHMVSAWVNAENITLGQLATDSHSNEITAIPRLLDVLDIAGDTVTIDAMGCQTAIAEQIREKKAHYVLSVKENQPSLYEAIREYFQFLDEGKLPGLPEDIWEGELEKDHGRIEKRRVRTACDIDFLTADGKWKDLRTIIEYRCERTVGEKTTTTVRYYISSRDSYADEFGRIIRGHWAIENRLHWALDVSFGEDACRARKDNSPKNLTVLRKIAIGLLRAVDAGKRVSLKRKMRMACIDPDFMRKVIFER